MTTHWGEIPTKPVSDFFIPDVTADIERSMNKFCLDQYEDDSNGEKTEQIILTTMDPLILYAISLHKYANDMTEKIRVAELATEITVKPPEDAAPPMPIMPEIKIKHKRNSVNYIPFTPFSWGWKEEVPDLSYDIVKKIVTKCIATMFAHIGFETTHQSVLDVLSDVLESFYEKICHKLVLAAEEEEQENLSNFPNIIEKVLVEIGMGGVKGLHDYYQCRIVKYVSVLQKRCKELTDHYATLAVQSPSPSSDKMIKCLEFKKEEDKELAVKPENPEVHLTTFEGESGYHLLSSLEAEENLQNPAGENTEKMGNSSPGVVSLPPETDISNLSPFTKKKIN